MSKQVLIIGCGVIGLATAYYAARKGHRVAVLDRGTIEQENCSYGNAGLVVPSHLVPLAAPGMVAQGLKWMLKPDSPFYIKPRLDPGFARWLWQFWRSCTDRDYRHGLDAIARLNERTIWPGWIGNTNT